METSPLQPVRRKGRETRGLEERWPACGALEPDGLGSRFPSACHLVSVQLWAGYCSISHLCTGIVIDPSLRATVRIRCVCPSEWSLACGKGLPELCEEGGAVPWFGTLQPLAFGSNLRGVSSRSASCQLGERGKVRQLLPKRLPWL